MRYRAKAARRPFRFWWHSFALIAIILLLWWQIPMTAILYEPRTTQPHQPAARASYILLDPNQAPLLLRRSISAWTLASSSGSHNSDLELGGIELISPLAPPHFLEQGSLYPGTWKPSPPPSLDMPHPPLTLSSAPITPQLPGMLPPPATSAGYRLQISPPLREADFALTPPDNTPPERSGNARFHLETSPEGRVSHLLLLSPASTSTAWLLPYIFKAQSKTSATGTLEIAWWFPKP